MNLENRVNDGRRLLYSVLAGVVTTIGFATILYVTSVKPKYAENKMAQKYTLNSVSINKPAEPPTPETPNRRTSIIEYPAQSLMPRGINVEKIVEEHKKKLRKYEEKINESLATSLFQNPEEKEKRDTASHLMNVCGIPPDDKTETFRDAVSAYHEALEYRRSHEYDKNDLIAENLRKKYWELMCQVYPKSDPKKIPTGIGPMSVVQIKK
ncbi:MAG: hypothetical protein AABY07_05855 [Nanoarchaeota archaeon]